MMKSIIRILFLSCLVWVIFDCCSAKESIRQTPKPLPEPEEIYPFSDMVLCYGGSPHRKPFLWEASRFSDYVSYVDKSGKEQWLFDGFLFIEFCNTGRGDGIKWSYCTGYSQGDNKSAGKQLWLELINYWFKSESGFYALEQAVSEAASRIGEPSYKRKVVVSIPDPILHLQYDDLNTTTRYWGELNGKELDFNEPKDRLAACSWFADEILTRFNKAGFKNIELDGFYYIAEEITTPTEGWCYEMKKMDLVLPDLSKSLHEKGKKFYWIPYRHAPGYKKGKLYGFDFVWMQPNYFWDGDKNPFDESMLSILAARVGMELEMDEALIEGHNDCSLYKMRFRAYMANAKRYGLYGKYPFTYYIGGDAFRELKASSAPEDKKIFEEFCDFIINNPVRNRCE